MRYFTDPVRAEMEAWYIPTAFGKTYAPFGTVTMSSQTRITTAGTELVDLEGRTLAIHGDGAAWAFLDEAEAALFRDLDGRPAASVGSVWPADAVDGPESWLGHLYRRGLIALDGHRAVDTTLFDTSHNTPENHLVELLVTERCNLGCVYCLAGTNPKMPVMDEQTGKRTIDLAFGVGGDDPIGFEFSGGEPFLRYNLMRDLVSYIQQHPQRGSRAVHLSVQTNATLLDADRVAWLRDNDVRVGVSLDGQPGSHDRSRPLLGGGKSSPRITDGLQLLQEAGVPFGALVVLNRHNVDGVEGLAAFLIDTGITSFKLNPVAFLGTARDTWDDVGLTAEEVTRYFIDLLELVAAERLPLLEDNTRTMCEYLVSKQRATRCMRSHCGAGDTFQAIAANGDIYPCGRATQTPAMKLGNVADSDLVRLDQPARTHQLVTEIRRRRPGDLEDCRTCHYRQLCQAGCSAQAYERYGTVRHRTPECTLYKTMYPHLMRWLTFDGDAFSALAAAGYLGPDTVLVDHAPLVRHSPRAALR